MSGLSCMGGFRCPLRERCARYQAADRSTPVERLCEPGTHDCYEPMRLAPDAGFRVIQWPGLGPQPESQLCGPSSIAQ